MAEQAASNKAALAVPVRLCLPRSFSSDTELGIRTTSPVRRTPNKDGEEEEEKEEDKKVEEEGKQERG
ncbi:unnamed protein product [Pleuronectes platessa]|uniref:Uncharacterized protein n=1 Tax=Pleuronectes platessa TaxID=8262 RepID=A0A9N7UEF1_PLEPL|nr:unnamed protein product [Pleuronectes platessa]